MAAPMTRDPNVDSSVKGSSACNVVDLGWCPESWICHDDARWQQVTMKVPIQKRRVVLWTSGDIQGGLGLHLCVVVIFLLYHWMICGTSIGVQERGLDHVMSCS